MINKVVLIGRVGKDPEVTNLKDGSKMARTSLATSESFKKDNEKVEQTEWHNLVFWRGRADVVEKYVEKGQLMYVEGKLHYSVFEKDGRKHYRTEIVVENMKMLGGRPTEQVNNPKISITPASEGDDLPF